MTGLPAAVSFVAPSGTGKTTFLVQVLRELAGRGVQVGAVKHGSSRFEIDHPGKDSWRLTEAGASPMVISSSEKIALVQTGLEKEVPIGEIISRFMSGVDLVLTEGYKAEDLPKIEVHRAGTGSGLLFAGPRGEILDRSLIAVVSDADLEVPVPLFPLDDPGPTCDFLVRRFLEGRY